MPSESAGGDEIQAPPLPRYSGDSKVAATWHPHDDIPLCAHHRSVIYNLEQTDHVDDRESERVAAEMRRQCCGRGLTQ